MRKSQHCSVLKARTSRGTPSTGRSSHRSLSPYWRGKLGEVTQLEAATQGPDTTSRWSVAKRYGERGGGCSGGGGDGDGGGGGGGGGESGGKGSVSSTEQEQELPMTVQDAHMLPVAQPSG